MRFTCMLAALCATLSTAALAQESSSTRERIRVEVAEKQRLMRAGKVVCSNVRVTVRLHNGSRLAGVVKNGRFIERHDGLAFIASDRLAKDSGLRLWYCDQTNSYIFLPWETIAEHSIGEILSDDEVAKMGLEFERLAKETRERGDAGKVDPASGTVVKPDPAKPGKGEEPAEGGDPAKAGGAAKPAAPADKGPPLTDAQKALLAEFPPEDGWGLTKLQELEARKVRVHVYPNELEQKFIDHFAEWNEANELQRAYAAEKAAQHPTPAEPPAGGGQGSGAKAGATRPAPKPAPGAGTGSGG